MTNTSRIDAAIEETMKQQLKARLALQGKSITAWVQEKVVEELGRENVSAKDTRKGNVYER